MENNLIQIVERMGSLGLLGWLVVWATTTAWPKVCAHLDGVAARLDKIGEQLGELRGEVSALGSAALRGGGTATGGKQ